jgi:Mrp family chromosome partitioning ATPase
MAIAPLADAILLVAKAETTKRGAIAHSVDQLGQVGAAVRGGVLNNVSLSKRHASYGYGYGYGYGVDEAPDEEETWTPSRFDRVRGRSAPANGNGSGSAKPAPSLPLQDAGVEGPASVESASSPEAGARADS